MYVYLTRLNKWRKLTKKKGGEYQYTVSGNKLCLQKGMGVSYLAMPPKGGA